MQELDDVLTAAKLNNALVVSKWLKDVPKEDTSTRDSLVQVLQQAAQCLSVDVIGMFESCSKHCFILSLIVCQFLQHCQKRFCLRLLMLLMLMEWYNNTLYIGCTDIVIVTKLKHVQLTHNSSQLKMLVHDHCSR